MTNEERQALELIRERLTIAEGRLYEHVSSTFRWLMATLFAANGGAVVALLGPGSSLPGKLYAMAWFAIGIILSIGMGALSALSGLRTSLAVVKAQTDIQGGLITDKVPTSTIEALNEHKPSWRTYVPTFVGVGSLVFFVTGIATIVGSLVRQAS